MLLLHLNLQQNVSIPITSAEAQNVMTDLCQEHCSEDLNTSVHMGDKEIYVFPQTLNTGHPVFQRFRAFSLPNIQSCMISTNFLNLISFDKCYFKQIQMMKKKMMMM